MESQFHIADAPLTENKRNHCSFYFVERIRSTYYLGELSTSEGLYFITWNDKWWCGIFHSRY